MSYSLFTPIIELYKALFARKDFKKIAEKLSHYEQKAKGLHVPNHSSSNIKPQAMEVRKGLELLLLKREREISCPRIVFQEILRRYKGESDLEIKEIYEELIPQLHRKFKRKLDRDPHPHGSLVQEIDKPLLLMMHTKERLKDLLDKDYRPSRPGILIQDTLNRYKREVLAEMKNLYEKFIPEIYSKFIKDGYTALHLKPEDQRVLLSLINEAA